MLYYKLYYNHRKHSTRCVEKSFSETENKIDNNILLLYLKMLV